MQHVFFVEVVVDTSEEGGQGAVACGMTAYADIGQFLDLRIVQVRMVPTVTEKQVVAACFKVFAELVLFNGLS